MVEGVVCISSAARGKLIIPRWSMLMMSVVVATPVSFDVGHMLFIRDAAMKGPLKERTSISTRTEKRRSSPQTYRYGCLRQPYVSRYLPYRVPYETPSSLAAFFISSVLFLMPSMTRLVNGSSQNCGRRPLVR